MQAVPNFTNLQVVIDAQAQAKAEFPKESCGLIIGDTYLPCVNIHEKPEEFFKIDQAIVDKYMMEKTLRGVIHSHPHEHISEKSCPSAADMISQMSMGVPYGIIDVAPDVVAMPYWWGDFQLDEPILGLEFHHGVNDCWTTIRRWTWQNRKVKLPDVPRDKEWWAAGGDLYVQGFKDMGFTSIYKEDLKDGDYLLGKVRSDKINHAGVYLHNQKDGLGVVLHHLPMRLSRRESAHPWVHQADLFLRYEPK